jgi:hypothetical protein
MTDSVCTAYESRKQHNSSSTMKGIVLATKYNTFTYLMNNLKYIYIVCIIKTGSNIDSRIPSVVDVPIKFSYDDFVSIDLRLKSYVQNKYFRDKEEFVLVFRVSCVIQFVIKYFI